MYVCMLHYIILYYPKLPHGLMYSVYFLILSIHESCIDACSLSHQISLAISVVFLSLSLNSTAPLFSVLGFLVSPGEYTLRSIFRGASSEKINHMLCLGSFCDSCFCFVFPVVAQQPGCPMVNMSIEFVLHTNTNTTKLCSRSRSQGKHIVSP